MYRTARIAGGSAVFAFLILLLPTVDLGASGPEPVVAHDGDGSTKNLRVKGDRLFVTARLNGLQTDDALLDSGAEMSLVDSRFAQIAGLATAGSETARGTGGEQDVTFAQGVTIEAAGRSLPDRTVAVLDLQDLSQRLIGAPLTMIVGRDLFDAGRLVIDIANHRITPVGRELEPPGVRLDMQTHHGLQTIPVSVEGEGPVQADFDLGNGSEVLIGLAYAERRGLLSPDRIVGRKSGGGIGGEVIRDLVMIRTLEIAGLVFTDVTAAVDPTENAADLNVGVRILRNFHMTVDFAENAVWLVPVEGP